MDKNEALAVIGNSLIEMHNHPTVYIQKAAFPAAVYGGMEACAVNPACVRLVHTVIATAAGSAASFGIKETFEKAPEIERKFSTPIHEYKSENEGFSIWNYLPTWLGGFDHHDYKSADEGFIPEDVDTSILMKDWEVKEFDKAVISDKFGKIYRDPKATSENGRRIWWSKDTAGHGGSAWKVFEETDKGLSWYKDADKNGNYIYGKHKGPIGKTIEWKDLRGTTVNGK